MRQDIADETVDSILVKEGRLEITFLSHANCLISQCCFYQSHDSIHIKIYDFLLVFRFFFTENSGFDQKNALNPCTLLAAFWQYTYILGDVNDIKSNAQDSGISHKEGTNVRLLYYIIWL